MVCDSYNTYDELQLQLATYDRRLERIGGIGEGGAKKEYWGAGGPGGEYLQAQLAEIKCGGGSLVGEEMEMGALKVELEANQQITQSP